MKVLTATEPSLMPLCRETFLAIVLFFFPGRFGQNKEVIISALSDCSALSLVNDGKSRLWRYGEAF